MNNSLVVHSTMCKWPLTITLLISGALIFFGGFEESNLIAIFFGFFVVLTSILLRTQKATSELRIDNKGIKTASHGLISWEDIKDLSWTVAEMKGDPTVSALPKSWIKVIIMYIDVYNYNQYWDRMSWFNKFRHNQDKKLKNRSDRLRTSLKFYGKDQDEIVKSACNLFYKYKGEHATICSRAKINPGTASSFHYKRCR